MFDAFLVRIRHFDLVDIRLLPYIIIASQITAVGKCCKIAPIQHNYEIQEVMWVRGHFSKSIHTIRG